MTNVSEFLSTLQREVIIIHVGQGEIQTGNPSWEFFVVEHGEQPDGQQPSAPGTGGGDDTSNILDETDNTLRRTEERECKLKV